jgi:uncharacterized protein YecE (DUF72 family)
MILSRFKRQFGGFALQLESVEMIDWQIGCSGFHYKHWKGLFYPADLPQTKWFEYYCRYFNTLELNVTFYRFPKYSFLDNWFRNSPDNFKFAVKAPRAITHFKKFNDTAGMISDFYNTSRDGLKEKLGCVLFQLPPMLVYTPERLEKIVSSLDNSFQNVLEFRHSSWWTEDVYHVLTSNNISFCGMSHPTLPADVVTTTAVQYYRFHGDIQLYASLYSRDELQIFADALSKTDTIETAYIYFNNDIHAHAIMNAQQLNDIVRNK